MSFLGDKKREHESAAVVAYKEGDLARAAFHYFKSAEFGLRLAEESEGKIKRRFIEDANELIDLAEKLKAKAKMGAASKASTSGKKSSAETVDGDSSQPSQWVVSEKSAVRLADVKGLAEAKRVVEDALTNPVKYPDIYKSLKVKPGTGLLLYGPPGTGKSMFAKAIANEIDAAFMHVKLNELKSKYVGDSEKNVAEMFKQARGYPRCVLFLDECESILRKRGSQKIATVEQFLQEADGFQESPNQLFILLATNRPWLIDSAVLRSGRISARAYVDLPDTEARRQIVQDALNGVLLESDVDIEKLVVSTEGFSGAEIHHHQGGGVCDEARLVAARRHIQSIVQQPNSSQKPEITPSVKWSDFEEALKRVVPTSKRDPEIIKKNRNWGGESDQSTGEEEGDET